jgi:hypothetical protein
MTVVLVLLLTTLLEGGVSYTMTFGRLDSLISIRIKSETQAAWFVVRALATVVVASLWISNHQRWLFRAIFVTNALLTVALMTSAMALVDALLDVSRESAGILLSDVVLMAVSNVLVFSVWYWIIDPPGIDESPKFDQPWDFLFPQRASPLPHYESWMPRYTDYLYLAFTTTLAFSPADTIPLTRRAKLLMLLQALVSVVTIVVIAGSAINNL